jgi:hypothetical protein
MQTVLTKNFWILISAALFLAIFHCTNTSCATPRSIRSATAAPSISQRLLAPRYSLLPTLSKSSMQPRPPVSTAPSAYAPRFASLSSLFFRPSLPKPTFNRTTDEQHKITDLFDAWAETKSMPIGPLAPHFTFALDLLEKANRLIAKIYQEHGSWPWEPPLQFLLDDLVQNGKRLACILKTRQEFQGNPLSLVQYMVGTLCSKDQLFKGRTATLLYNRLIADKNRWRSRENQRKLFLWLFKTYGAGQPLPF